jgi:hypothetical protein
MQALNAPPIAIPGDHALRILGGGHGERGQECQGQFNFLKNDNSKRPKTVE